MIKLERNGSLVRTVSKRPLVIVHTHMRSSLRPDVVFVEGAYAKSVGLTEMFTFSRYIDFGDY